MIPRIFLEPFLLPISHFSKAYRCIIMFGYEWRPFLLRNPRVKLLVWNEETNGEFHISSSVSKRSASLVSSSGLVLISLENVISSQNFISERNIERKEKETLIYFIIRPIFTLTNRTMISICCVFLSESSSNKYFTPVGHAMWRQENGWHAALCPLDNTLYWKYFQ